MLYKFYGTMYELIILYIINNKFIKILKQFEIIFHQKVTIQCNVSVCANKNEEMKKIHIKINIIAIVHILINKKKTRRKLNINQ